MSNANDWYKTRQTQNTEWEQHCNKADAYIETHYKHMSSYKRELIKHIIRGETVSCGRYDRRVCEQAAREVTSAIQEEND